MNQTPFERLRVWQAAVELVGEVYAATTTFPAHERFGITSQLRRAAVSVVTNIAEGSARHGPKAFAAFCDIAFGSLKEAEALMILANRLGFLDREATDRLRSTAQSVARQLYPLTAKLRSSQRSSAQDTARPPVCPSALRPSANLKAPPCTSPSTPRTA